MKIIIIVLNHVIIIITVVTIRIGMDEIITTIIDHQLDHMYPKEIIIHHMKPLIIIIIIRNTPQHNNNNNDNDSNIPFDNPSEDFKVNDTSDNSNKNNKNVSNNASYYQNNTHQL